MSLCKERAMSTSVDREQMLQVVKSLQSDVAQTYAQRTSEYTMMYYELLERIEGVRRAVRAQSTSSHMPGAATAAANAASLLQQHRQRNQQSGSHHGTPAGFTPSTPPRGRPAAPPASGPFSTNGDDDVDWGVGGGNALAASHNSVHTDMLATPPHPQQRADFTPTGSPQSIEKLPIEQLFVRLSNASNSPPINFETLYEQLAGKDDNSPQMPPSMHSHAFSQPVPYAGAQRTTNLGGGGGDFGGSSGTIPMDSLAGLNGQHQTRGVQVASSNASNNFRPRVAPIPNGGSDDPAALDIDPSARCQVLVEFKRKRVLQYDSQRYVGPGEYVVVGGDRGEDVGLVIYTWCETNAKTVKGIGLTGSSLTRSIGVGSGVVLRLASEQEISQLHNVQAELERRAVGVCMQRVLEHGLPMVIVDAEYQFDKKKLTFFYEAQQRMDFRELVRDLFKTFRARIWMELVEN